MSLVAVCLTGLLSLAPVVPAFAQAPVVRSFVIRRRPPPPRGGCACAWKPVKIESTAIGATRTFCPRITRDSWPVCPSGHTFDYEAHSCVRCFNILNNKNRKNDWGLGLMPAIVTTPMPPLDNATVATGGSCQCRTAPPSYQSFWMEGSIVDDTPCPSPTTRRIATCPGDYQYDVESRLCVLCRNDWPKSPRPPPPSPCAACVTVPLKFRRRVIPAGSPGRCGTVRFEPYCPPSMAMILSAYACTSCPAIARVSDAEVAV